MAYDQVTAATSVSLVISHLRREQMIDEGLTLLSSKLNAHLKSIHALPGDVVSLSNLRAQNGAVVDDTENRLLVFLVNISKDALRSKATPAHDPAGRLDRAGQALHLTLHVMIAAHFNGSRYSEGLKFLSEATQFFHDRPIFSAANTPKMSDSIERLDVEMGSLNPSEMSSLWVGIGGACLPSVLYTVRMLTVDSVPLTRPSPIVGRGV